MKSQNYCRKFAPLSSLSTCCTSVYASHSSITSFEKVLLVTSSSTVSVAHDNIKASLTALFLPPLRFKQKTWMPFKLFLFFRLFLYLSLSLATSVGTHGTSNLYLDLPNDWNLVEGILSFQLR